MSTSESTSTLNFKDTSLNTKVLQKNVFTKKVDWDENEGGGGGATNIWD